MYSNSRRDLSWSTLLCTGTRNTSLSFDRSSDMQPCTRIFELSFDLELLHQVPVVAIELALARQAHKLEPIDIAADLARL